MASPVLQTSAATSSGANNVTSLTVTKPASLAVGDLTEVRRQMQKAFGL